MTAADLPMSNRVWAGIFVLAVSLSTFYANRETIMRRRSKIIRVALQGKIPAGQLSPENISTIALYHLHYNLWDTLITSDQSSAIARSFRVSPDNLTLSFEIDPDAKFSNGRSITAADVKSAFERIMAREENGHINAKSVIRKITASSPTGLRIDLLAPTPSFLFLLTTPEFGIVPMEALDGSGNVTDLSVTSGAFSVANADTESQIVHLVRNKFFRRAIANAPEEVEISFLRNLGPTLGDFDFVEIRSSEAEQIVS